MARGNKGNGGVKTEGGSAAARPLLAAFQGHEEDAGDDDGRWFLEGFPEGNGALKDASGAAGGNTGEKRRL
ncbi:hypothetical protein H2203_004846 [Taxawa tesnikishii (nom. ined.)]|nr:hypothetical protein H2203_004846 [Dothideales sp. JES 119]